MGKQSPDILRFIEGKGVMSTKHKEAPWLSQSDFSPKVDAELGLLLLRSSPGGRERFDWRESRLVSSSELAELEPSEAFLFTEGNDFLILSKKERFSSSLSGSFPGKSVTN